MTGIKIEMEMSQIRKAISHLLCRRRRDVLINDTNLEIVGGSRVLSRSSSPYRLDTIDL
jgi:hypothetical protein